MLKTSTATTRQSSLSLILFVRYGDMIFTLLKLLKGDNWITVDGWMLESSYNEHLKSSHVDSSPLDLLIPRRSGSNQVAIPAIKKFFGTVGDLLLSEWLGKSLSDFLKDSCIPSKWYPIPVPSSILCPVQHPANDILLRCTVSPSIPERMAGDRMECGCVTAIQLDNISLLDGLHVSEGDAAQALTLYVRPMSTNATKARVGSIRFTQPVGAFMKQEALRHLVETLQLEDSPPIEPEKD
ncbi:hypothetical protein P3T76_012449 [Phytophthora citrophthora]|uniref:Uncharacterized protein n=1 Tax=Phytophthora citrophthora TaxID=4793 RepID=A0AAD9G4E9_9STRA|nr:hypothetical protein P3T76_012449 [Phytophthora citrophthora]